MDTGRGPTRGPRRSPARRRCRSRPARSCVCRTPRRASSLIPYHRPRREPRATSYNDFGLAHLMPRRLGRKLMLSITVIVVIVAAVSGLVNITTEERQLLNTMVLGADQL